MSNFTVSSGIKCSEANGLPQSQVVLVGRNKHLKKLRLSNGLAEKLKGIDPKLFDEAINQLQPTGSVPLYLNLAKLISVSDDVSRCNTPSNSLAIFKELKSLQVASGIKNSSIILYSEYEHLLASVSACARAFPTYSRKTNVKNALENIELEIVVTDEKPLADADVNFLQSLANSIRTCGSHVDTPCNELHSEAFLADAQRLIGELRQSGFEITEEVIQGEDLLTKGFGGIYHVGKAARNPPIFARFTYKPKDATESIALVGKGIVFDTGGMQIKTKTGMPSMKRDMAGAAALLGAFCTLVKSGFKQELHCLMCIAENNISPDANKPDDIIVMLSGKTVEINNTDAEGRLVLADGCYYAKNSLSAKTIIDMATLTGAQAYVSGKLMGAFLSNKEDWEKAAIKAGKRSGDLVSPLPYCPDLHFPDLKSSLADMKNSNLGKMEGPPSAVAGLFIGSHMDFSEEVNWLHFDIASPSESGERSTAFAIPLICSLLSEHLDVGVAK